MNFLLNCSILTKPAMDREIKGFNLLNTQDLSCRKLITFLQLLGSLYIDEVRKTTKNIVGCVPFTTFEICVGNNVFFTVYEHFRYVGWNFGTPHTWVTTEFSTYDQPDINLTELVKLYFKMMNLLNTKNFQISVFGKDDAFLQKRYRITVENKEFQVEHQCVQRIEERFQKDFPYYLKQ